MKNIFLLLVFDLLLCFNAKSQSPVDSISYNKTIGMNRFEHNGQIIGPREMIKLMEVDSLAHNMMWKAKTNYDLSILMSVVGVILATFPATQSNDDGKRSWTYAGIGGGLLLLSIPVRNGYNKRAMAAVRIYIILKLVISNRTAMYGLIWV